MVRVGSSHAVVNVIYYTITIDIGRITHIERIARTNIAAITDTITVGIDLQRIGKEWAVIWAQRDWTKSIAKPAIAHTIAVNIGARITGITDAIAVVIGLGVIGN